MADLATIDSPFGAQPWGNVLRARMYSIITNPTLAFFIQDLVAIEGLAIATPVYGPLLGLEEDATPAAGNAAYYVGSIMALFTSTHDPTLSIAASTTGNGTIAGYALVADHPMQEFIMQEDGDTNSIQVAAIAQNADFIVGSGGSTTTGLSSHMIDSDQTDATATTDLKLHNVHPEDTISPAGAAGNYARFIVSINAHFWGDNLAGA